MALLQRKKNTLKDWKKQQERVLRSSEKSSPFIYEASESTYQSLLWSKSKLTSLKKGRRLRTIEVETFKLIHKQSTSYLHDLISIKDKDIMFFFLYYIYITPVNNLPLGARKPQRFTNIYNEQYN